MRIISIEVTTARTLEHAMDLAVEEAGNRCYPSDSKERFEVKTVTFKSFVAEGTGRDSYYCYTFEAELETL